MKPESSPVLPVQRDGFSSSGQKKSDIPLHARKTTNEKSFSRDEHLLKLSPSPRLLYARGNRVVLTLSLGALTSSQIFAFAARKDLAALTNAATHDN